MASLALRGGIEPGEIVKQMRGISCHLPVGYGDGKVMSCSDAMAQAMDWYMGYKNATGQTLMLESRDIAAIGGETAPLSFLPVFNRGACPDCGGTVEHVDGCVVCRGCGYTECG
jgi:ribonucleoside-diphosphate reductase alpha chain